VLVFVCCNPRLGLVLLCRRRSSRAEAIKTQREKQQTEAPVVESFRAREAAPLDGADDPMVPSDESWVVKLEQSVNIFLTVIRVAPTQISSIIQLPSQNHCNPGSDVVYPYISDGFECSSFCRSR